MGAFSMWHWIILLGGGLILFSAAGSRRRGNQTYVIKEWHASEAPNKDGVYVHIIGRKGGLISFVFSLVGIDPIVTLVVDRECIRFLEGSWNGFESSVTPIEKFCSGEFGYAKPFWSTVIWIIIGIILLIPSFGTSLILIVCASLYYYLNKTTKIGIAYINGNKNGFLFKRSVIEGKNIDVSDAGRIIAIIEMIMLGKEKLSGGYADAGMGSSGGIDATEQARQKMDALKAQAMRAGERAASKVAASLASASENMPHAASAPELKCPGCGVGIAAADAFCANCGRAVR